jgi:hypothetical protein
MAPCPLCLLDFPQPHTKADWEKLKTDQNLKDRLDIIFSDPKMIHGGGVNILDIDSPLLAFGIWPLKTTKPDLYTEEKVLEYYRQASQPEES